MYIYKYRMIKKFWGQCTNMKKKKIKNCIERIYNRYLLLILAFGKLELSTFIFHHINIHFFILLFIFEKIEPCDFPTCNFVLISIHAKCLRGYIYARHILHYIVKCVRWLLWASLCGIFSGTRVSNKSTECICHHIYKQRWVNKREKDIV